LGNNGRVFFPMRFVFTLPLDDALRAALLFGKGCDFSRLIHGLLIGGALLRLHLPPPRPKRARIFA
jgi:hypothetical protein